MTLPDGDVGDLIIRLLAAADSLPALQATEVKDVATKLCVAITAERRRIKGSVEKEISDLKLEVHKNKSMNGSLRSQLNRAQSPAPSPWEPSASRTSTFGTPSRITAANTPQSLSSTNTGYGNGVAHFNNGTPTLAIVPESQRSLAPMRQSPFGRLTPPPLSGTSTSSKKRPLSMESTNRFPKRARADDPRQPVCINCSSGSPLVPCNHKSQCSNCEAKNMRCVYLQCGPPCAKLDCTLLHPDQWTAEERLRWNVTGKPRPQEHQAIGNGIYRATPQPAPVQNSRMSSPVQGSRVGPPEQGNHMRPPVQNNRMHPPAQNSRMSPPVQNSRMSPPVHPDRLAMQALYDPAHMPFETNDGNASGFLKHEGPLQIDNVKIKREDDHEEGEVH